MTNNSSGKKSSKQKNSCYLFNIKNPARVAERLKVTFKRVEAKLCVTKAGQEFDVGLTLLDVSESGVGVYTNQMISKGASIELNILEPKILKVKGVVAWCVPATSNMNSLVIRYPYRCGIQFIFSSEVERAAVAEFILKIREKQTSKIPTAIAKSDDLTATPPEPVVVEVAPDAKDATVPEAAAPEAVPEEEKKAA